MTSVRSLRRLTAIALAVAGFASCRPSTATSQADGAPADGRSKSGMDAAAPSAAPSAAWPASASSSASSPASSASSGSPLSRLVPVARPGARTPCPLTIEPGVAFGPIALGETLADLVRAGLAVKNVSDSHAEVTLPGAPGAKPSELKVSLCEGKIIDVWIDDLREAPACVAYAGTTFAPTIAREDLEKALGGCAETDPRIGGAFERCQGGGVYVGHGMGSFLQIRVRPKSFPFDDACAIATDDGSAIVLAPAEQTSLLKQTLNLRGLSDHWHVNEPGRDPLRIVKTPLIAEQPLMMFGSPVAWIDESDARKGTAFFTITKLAATKTKATLAFTYPIEGVVGAATFARVTGTTEWRLESSDVHER
jgi:hypothetical protein